MEPLYVDLCLAFGGGGGGGGLGPEGNISLDATENFLSHNATVTSSPRAWANLTNQSSWAESVGQDYGDSWDHDFKVNPAIENAKFYLHAVLSPMLSVIGIIGNMLNMLVLTRRRMQSSMDCSMERAAYMGLIALAFSDLIFCIITLPESFLGTKETMFFSRSFRMYSQLYGKCLQNFLGHTSTWLTVIMAVGRYAAICHPLHARQFVHARGMRVTIVMTFILWLCLVLPCFWTYTVVPIHCPGPEAFSIYILDQGPFSTNMSLRHTFNYIWFGIGYLIPVCMLAYCNAHLIRALRESYKMRKEYRVHSSQGSKEPASRITPTLVAIVLMYIILVSPSEILNFVYYTVKDSHVEGVTLAIVVTNLLHYSNFAVNFILYSVVNVHFRNTLKDIVFFLLRRDRRRHTRPYSGASYSNVTTKTYAISPSTTETII